MEVEIETIKSNRRSFALEIKPDGHVIVRAPNYATKNEINAFVKKNEKWLEIHLEKVLSKNRLCENTEKLSEKQIEELTLCAKEIILKKAEYFAPIVGVTYGKITIRHQKTRWGSCSSKGNLNFNCLLMFVPEFVLDYVVVHELCHIKQMNHSPAFKAEIARVLPEYKKCEKWLKQNGSAIMMKIK